MLRPLLALILLGAACEGGHSLSSPVLRVDLRDRLPEAVQRRLAQADTSYECRRGFALEAQGVQQRFLATWRVLDEGGARLVTTVQLEPQGDTVGGSDPSASAAVGEPRVRGNAARVPLRVTWTASKGCGRVSASRELELAADEAGCKPPQRPGRLLVPVR